MTTSDDIKTEVSWLNKGAVDFIPKPFHPDAVKARRKNAINLRESVAMLSATEFDELTGFYTRGAFLKHAEILLQKRPDVRFDLVTATIFDFDQISYKYGSDMATEMVRCIGKSVLELAHNIVNMMKMKTVQEGVETQSELERVRDLGCAFVQGFYFSKPLCKKDFVTFIKNMKV